MHVSRERKERTRTQDLYWFTLPQELHLVSLPASKEIHSRTKRSHIIQYNALAPCK